MQEKSVGKAKNTARSSAPISYRPSSKILPRFLDVVEVSKRSKSSILHESLEARLPNLEKQYRPQLRALKKSKTAEAKA